MIEDNAADVRLMREALRDLEPPIDLHAASDADEALLFLRRKGAHAAAPRPSLIFLDFNLPKSDPRELLRQLKQDEYLRLIPVAVLTTSDAGVDVREAYQLYANCYLRKPVDLEGFFNVIRAAAHFWLNVAYLPAEIASDEATRFHLL